MLTHPRNHVLGDDVPESVRVPTDAAWFKNVALRDLVLHEQHAACVDARGDVYQWGDGFFGSTPGQSHARPELTLKGKVRVFISVNFGMGPSSLPPRDRTSRNSN